MLHGFQGAERGRGAVDGTLISESCVMSILCRSIVRGKLGSRLCVDKDFSHTQKFSFLSGKWVLCLLGYMFSFESDTSGNNMLGLIYSHQPSIGDKATDRAILDKCLW